MASEADIYFGNGVAKPIIKVTKNGWLAV